MRRPRPGRGVNSAMSHMVLRVPPHVYFVTSAVFHYLGPALAVLLFARIDPLGVAWLRIATAALAFAMWRRPWRVWHCLDTPSRASTEELLLELRRRIIAPRDRRHNTWDDWDGPEPQGDKGGLDPHGDWPEQG